MPALDRSYWRSHGLGVVACVFLLSGSGMLWIGSGASKETGSDMPLYAASVVVVSLAWLLLRAWVMGRPAPTPQHQQRSCSPQAFVGDCFARTHHTTTIHAPNNPAGSNNSNNSNNTAVSPSSFGTRLRQFLAGRPLTLEEQHRRALALARAGVRTGGGGGDAAMELSFLSLMDRDFDPSDYELLSRLDESVDNSSRLGATATELELLPLHTVSKEEAAGALSGGVGVGKVSSSCATTCTICLEAWEAGDVTRTLPCTHFFHAACLDPWLKRRFQCPLCNMQF